MRLALRLVMISLALVCAATACPSLPPVSSCTVGAWRCTDDGRPQVCSASSRWESAGERACPATGGVCVVERTAHCAPARDAATDASEVGL